MISNHHGVQGLPTFMTFVNGDEYERKVGSQTDRQLTEMIERSIAGFGKVRGENPDSETLTSEEEQRIIQEQLKNLGYL